MPGNFAKVVSKQPGLWDLCGQLYRNRVQSGLLERLRERQVATVLVSGGIADMEG